MKTNIAHIIIAASGLIIIFYQIMKNIFKDFEE